MIVMAVECLPGVVSGEQPLVVGAGIILRLRDS